MFMKIVQVQKRQIGKYRKRGCLFWKWNGNVSFERVDKKEEALEDSHLYYLSGDTLILGGNEYKRSKNMIKNGFGEKKNLLITIRIKLFSKK